MSNSILSTDSLTSQEIDKLVDQQLTVARVEINFERLPIWSPKPKRGTVFVPSKVITLDDEHLPNGNIVQRKIKIIPSAEYGYPTVQTQEYWYALQKLWHESAVKDAGRIDFTRRIIIEKILGKKYGKDQRKALDLSIMQLAYTGYNFDYTVYDKDRDEWYHELRGFSLLTDCHLTEKTSKTKVVHDKCSITLHPLIVSNLRCGYVKPILLSVVSQLKSDIARLLYRKLDSHFAYYTKYEVSTTRFFREHALEGKEYVYPSTRKRLLEKAIAELLHKPTSSGAVIIKSEFAKTADGSDWKLLVWGKSASKSPKTQPKQQQQSQAVESPTVASKPKARANPIPVSKTATTGSTEALEVLFYFAKTFKLEEQQEYHPNDVRKAEQIVTKYGLKIAKFFIKFALGEANKTNYKPQYLRGIMKFLKAAIAESERQERIGKRQAEEIAKRKFDNAQIDHEKKYYGEYEEFVSSLIESLLDIHASRFDEFRKYQTDKRLTIIEQFSANPKMQRLQLECFDKSSQMVKRVVDFFKDDPDINIPDFWEWDKTYNPKPFSYHTS